MTAHHPTRSDVVLVGIDIAKHRHEFGGLEVARALGRAGIDATVILWKNHHLFQPLLYQVATAALSATDVAEPIRKVLRRHNSVQVLYGEVSETDAGAREVRMTCGQTLGFRHLVVASGAGHSYFGRDEWAQWAPGLKTIEDARHIRSRLLLTFERAEQTPDPAERERLLRVAIIGGGPTGVEFAGSIAELSRYTLARDFRDIYPHGTCVTLLDAGSRLLSGFSEESSAYATARLEGLRVEVRTSEAVEHVGPTSITVAGEDVPVGMVIRAAGVAASPLARQLGRTDGAGRIAVGEDLSLPSLENVFALGDLAVFTGEGGRPLPGLAQVAKQQGTHFGRSLAARIASGEPMPPFRYHSRGNTAIVGRHSAVFDQGRVKVKGWIAWLWSPIA